MNDDYARAARANQRKRERAYARILAELSAEEPAMQEPTKPTRSTKSDTRGDRETGSRVSQYLVLASVAAALTAAAVVVIVLGAARGPRSYDDCILQNMRSGMSDRAVRLVDSACRSKFSPDPPAGGRWWEEAPIVEPAPRDP